MKSKLLSLFVTAILAVSFNPEAYGQCTPPIFSINQAPTVVGTAGTVGAKYRRTNVTPGVDIEMEILSFTGTASLVSEDNPVGVPPAAPASGYYEPWQPIVRTNAGTGTGGITWRVSFFANGSAFLTPYLFNCLSILALDVDGDAGSTTREFVEAVNPYSYVGQSATVFLTYTQTATTLRAQATTTATITNIDSTRRDAEMQFNFKNITSFTYTTGYSKTNTTTADKQFSLLFRGTPNFTAPFVKYFNTDKDGSNSINEANDLDDDNDGIPDTQEYPAGYADPMGDADLDNIPNYMDATPGVIGNTFADTNGDGINDNYDIDLDGLVNSIDLDSDNDGIPDLVEAGGIDTDGDGVVDITTDADTDGLLDVYDSNSGGVNIANLDTDGDGVPNFRDLDSDNDGIPDTVEAGATDANNDGKRDVFTDIDGDGLADAVDGNVNNDATIENTAGALIITSAVGGTPGLPASYPRANADANGLPNPYDLDADGDGILDVREAGITDTNNDGIADGALGTDGWSDTVDALATLTLLNTDGGVRADYLDIDADNDGIVDNIEGQTTAGYTAPAGADSDNDGIDNTYDNDDAAFAGTASNGITPTNSDGIDIADYRDLDSDNDGYPDFFEGHDSDGDNLPDAGSPAANGVSGGTTDIDGDGLLDGYDNNTASVDPTNGTTATSYPNIDITGTPERDWREVANTDNSAGPNATDIDDDNDGIPDLTENGGFDALGDADADGIANYIDAVPGGGQPAFTDINADGINDFYDADLDGIINSLDLDSDNDGIPDIVEAGAIDTNGDGRVDITTDTDGDGLVDTYDTSNGGVNIANLDTDGDGIVNSKDIDSDNDGIPDVVEAGGTDANNDGKLDGYTDADGDGFAQSVDGDINNDGTADNTAGALIITSTVGGTPGRPASYPRANADANGLPNPYDLDADGDGILDVREAGLTDTNNDGVADGVLGTDGWSDTVDALPTLTPTNTDANGRPNYLDIDSDNDGIVDNIEGQTTAGYIAPAGADSDADGIDNAYDNNDAAFAGTANNGITPVDDTDDADTTPDYTDTDSDGDGKSDRLEGWDTNGNGVINGTEIVYVGTTDSDNDGLLNEYDADDVNPNPTNGTTPASYPDVNTPGGDRDWRQPSDKDGDGVADNIDMDDDNDGVPDTAESGGVDPNADADSDGIPNYLDPTPGAGVPAFVDANGDGINDAFDADGDGVINSGDLDSDNDGISDLVEAGGVDVNGDGRIDGPFADSDGDGLHNTYDASTGGDAIGNRDTDGDGIANAYDLDSDNDGIPDVIEAGGADGNNDGKVDFYSDADGDGFTNDYDGDIDNDGTAENAAAALIITGTDGNSDGQPDTYTRANQDATGLPNPYDLDADDDGILDVREAGLPDTNNDGVVDGTLGVDGWSDAVDALPTFTPVNTDGIGKANYLDIDSDDDGIVDNIEGQTTAGYIAASGTDSDNDGIDNAYDNNDAAFAGNASNGITPNNEESSGNPDYTDTDTDNDGKSDALEGWDTNSNNVIDGAERTGGVLDADGDGLLDGYDNNTAASNPANGTTPASYPDADLSTPQRAWREPVDADGDGVTNSVDIDDDNDGVPDTQENPGGFDPTADADADGIPNFLDPTPGAGLPAFVDANGDGINDAYDTDTDGVLNQFDLDSDNDGIADLVEAGGVDTNGDGRIDGAFADTDGDGLHNTYDPSTGGDAIANRDTDGDGISNEKDTDSDNDGIPDVIEAGGTDANNDGIIDGFTDTDGDGFAQSVDGDANNDGTAENTATVLIITGTDGNSDGQPDTYPRANADANGLPNPYDLDSDGDGILDVREAGLTDTNNDGVADGTLGADGWSDAVDALGTLTPTNTDGTTGADYLDIDSDNDGIPDNIEGQTTAGYLAPSGTDSDNDGIDNAYDNDDAAFAGNAANGITPTNTDGIDTADYTDGDTDGDGKTDRIEGWDTNGNGIIDGAEITYVGTTDADNDGLLDEYDADDANSNPTNGTTPASYPDVNPAGGDRDWREVADTDNDGVSNAVDADDDNDGIPDTIEGAGDTDGDGIPDSADLDSDNDGIADVAEAGGVDTNGDGRIDGAFADADGDGLHDTYDPSSGGDAIANRDTDGDGVANSKDLDSDNDGISDVIEGDGTDGNNDGKVDFYSDADNDGFTNDYDGDIDNDGTAENAAAALIVTGADTNSDGQPDSYPRANTDKLGLPNPYDLDADGDGILDVTEAGLTDTNNDGVADGALGADGWSDTVDALASLNLPNSDGAGPANYLDIDADDDGLTDNVEGQSTAGYQLPSGVDTDGDGIDDVYDNNDAAFAGNANNGIIPYNHDGADNPDYTDTDSDNDSVNDLKEGSGDVNATLTNTADTDNDGLTDQFDILNLNTETTNLQNNVTLVGMGNGGSTTGPVPAGSNITASQTPAGAPNRDWRNSVFVLPVTLISFNAEERNGLAYLRWTAENEINFSSYIVERSTNGSDFITVGSVAPINNGGRNNYQFTDNLQQLSATVVYYRLKMVDLDGKFKYSSVLRVSPGKTLVRSLTITPNPVTENMQLRINSDITSNVRIQITSIVGQVLYQSKQQVYKGENIVPVQGLSGKLAKGTYLVTVAIEGQVLTSKFIY
jgi:large repetitive protein